jgi:hypothetical protein
MNNTAPKIITIEPTRIPVSPKVVQNFPMEILPDIGKLRNPTLTDIKMARILQNIKRGFAKSEVLNTMFNFPMQT